MVRQGKLKLDDRGCVYDPNIKEQDLDVVPADLDPMEEYFNDGHHCELMVTRALAILKLHVVHYYMNLMILTMIQIGHCLTTFIFFLIRVVDYS